MKGLNFAQKMMWFSVLTQGVGFAIPIATNKLASELKMGPKTVRVRLSGLGRVMSIRGTGLALSLAKRPDLGNVTAEEWVIDCKRSLIYQPLTNKVRKIPRSGVLIESLSGVLSVNEKRFQEQLVVYPEEVLSPYDGSVRSNAECLVVNHIQIEKYLVSVVNAEFNSKWAAPAVEAQIIAARTYALYQMKEMRKDSGRVFDVESTERDQVYLGLDRVDDKAHELVMKTRGMILVAKGSETSTPIKAFYHSSCGGRTVAPEQVWGAKFPGFGKGVRCPFCSQAPSREWEYRMSFYELEKKIWNGIEKDASGRKSWPEAYLKNPNAWILSQVKPIQKGSSGFLISGAVADAADLRTEELGFQFIHKKDPERTLQVKMSAYQARNWFDPVRMKSTLFNLTQMGRSVVFKGRGSGHGVGMCQWGAKRMGEKGYTRDQIIGFYYPGVKITRIWN